MVPRSFAFSNVRSCKRFGPPSWAPPTGLGLQNSIFGLLWPPSWRVGGALGLQVELFGALGTPRLESWTAWGLQVGVLEGFQASKFRSIERFGPRNWGLWSAPGLRVGFLRWILASKLGSRDTFWPPDAAGNHVRTQFSDTVRNFKKQLKNINLWFFMIRDGFGTPS